MASLEQIIRPFVVYDTAPARIPFTASSKPAQGNVIITVGKNGSAKTVGTSESSTQSYYCDNVHNEFVFKIGEGFGPTADYSPHFDT